MDCPERIKEGEEQLTGMENEFKERIGSAMEFVNSVEKKLVIEVPMREHTESQVQEAHMFIKILKGHLRAEKDNSRRLEEKAKDCKERLRATEDTICEMVEKEEKMQEEMDSAAMIFQDCTKELEVNAIMEITPATHIPIDLGVTFKI
eukprot:Gb_04495 [translate_table: standard]